MGWGYVQNTKCLFRAEMIPRKHHFWSFSAITIAVFKIQMILILMPLQNGHDGMGICAKHKTFISAEMIPRKHHIRSFLAITIAVCQIQMILTLIPFQNKHDGIPSLPPLLFSKKSAEFGEHLMLPVLLHLSTAY